MLVAVIRHITLDFNTVIISHQDLHRFVHSPFNTIEETIEDFDNFIITDDNITFISHNYIQQTVQLTSPKSHLHICHVIGNLRRRNQAAAKQEGRPIPNDDNSDWVCRIDFDDCLLAAVTRN